MKLMVCLRVLILPSSIHWKQNDRKFDNFVFIYGTGSCRNDNLRYSQLRLSCEIDDCLFSVYVSQQII